MKQAMPTQDACAVTAAGAVWKRSKSKNLPEAHWRSPPRTPPRTRMIRPTPSCEFPDNRLLIDLCGELDRNIVQIESRLGVAIHRRGNHLALHGPAPEREAAEQVLRGALRPAGAGAAGDAGRHRRGDPAGAGGPAPGAPRGPGQPARHVLGRAARDPHPAQAGRAAHRGAEGLRAQPLPQRAGVRARAGRHRQDLSGGGGGGVDVHRRPRRPDHPVAARRSRPASGSASCPAT